ncbi:MAG: hypothetical protein ACKOBW_13835 [Planctomycetota bacterium]
MVAAPAHRGASSPRELPFPVSPLLGNKKVVLDFLWGDVEQQLPVAVTTENPHGQTKSRSSLGHELRLKTFSIN